MTQPVPLQLLNTRNKEVLDYLAPLSCHGDNIEPLWALIATYPDVESFRLDAKNYRYFLWYFGDTIFAYGVGMRNVSLRIPDDSTAMTVDAGVDSFKFDVETWISLAYDYEQLGDMVKLAYDYAKT